MTKILSQDFLNERFEYDPLTGSLLWKMRPDSDFKNERAKNIWRSRYPGTIAGSTSNSTGYRAVKIGHYIYMAHRLIWTMVNGDTPDQVDHINGVRSDNRIENLRNTNRTGNVRNMKRGSDNSSGHTGVGWHKAAKRWRAYVSLDGKSKHLGHFDSMDAAIAARQAANVEYGFHPNHGRAS